MSLISARAGAVTKSLTKSNLIFHEWNLLCEVMLYLQSFYQG